MRVPRPAAVGLASAVTAAAVLIALPAAAAQTAGAAGPADAAAVGTAGTAAVGTAPLTTAPVTGDALGTGPLADNPVDATSTTSAAANTVCGTYGTMNAYIWASSVRVHTGPSSSNTAIGECGPSWVHAYCQLQGGEVVYGAYRNDWWIYADTQLGSFTNGYISDVFVSGGSNDAPVPGIPVCSS